MLEKIDALSGTVRPARNTVADNGYLSEANVMQRAAANIEPLIATGRQPHHPSWRERQHLHRIRRPTARRQGSR